MRRGFGRPVRPLRRAFSPDVPPLLRRANQMLLSGNYAEAASAFEQLARAAEARGGPRAPLFYIQSGRCQVLAGRVAVGIEAIERGLGLWAMRGQQARALNVGLRLVNELDARGLKQEAQQVAAYVEELVPGAPAQPPTPAAALPAHCPDCGAPLRPDEVEWLDRDTAACAYCGSPVHGDG